MSTCENIPQNLIKTVVDFNQIRKNHIFNMILRKNPKIVGMYSLIMKSDLDNFRNSAIHNSIDKIMNNNIKMITYEPLIYKNHFNDIDVINDLDV